MQQESGIDLSFDTIELEWNDWDTLLEEAEQKGYCELTWKPPAKRQLSPNPAPQASSYDPSLHSHQVGSATSAEQQQQQRSWSLDDRYLSGRDRGGLPAPPRVLPIKDLLVPPPPLDKKSQEQLDEFEEVILRMATMTRGSCGAQPQANGETPVPTHEETSPLSSDKNYDNFLYPQGGFDPSMTYASDRYHLPQDVRGGGVGRVSTQVSMRCAPYPATVSSPSSLEVSQSNARRGSTDHGGSRAAPQVKIQLSAPWDPPQHVTGLPPLAPPQSAKMLNSTSRTQLKQQLMRQQLQQQEARERELASRINIHQQQSSQQQQLQQQSLSNQQQYLQQQHQQQQYREQQIHQQEFLRQQQLQQQQQQTEKNHQMGPEHYSQHQHHQPQSDQQQGCISQQNQDLPMDQGFQTAPVPMVVQEPIDIPSSGCLIPPSQLPQVQSRLENPTLYHVVQSRKRQQMRQMQNDLGQVTDQGDFNSDRGTPAIPISCSDGTQRGTTTTQWPYSDPGRRMAINNGAGPGPVSQQAPSVPTSTSVTARGIRGYSAGRGPVGPRSGGSTPSSRFLSPPMNNTGASFVSSGVSSAATSLTSDASEV